MKKVLFVLVLVALALAALPQVASAETDVEKELRLVPELRVIAGHMGLAPNVVVLDWFRFNAAYGARNQFGENDPRWAATHYQRLNEYAKSRGVELPFQCGDVLCAQTLAYKLLVPIYRDMPVAQ